MKKFLGFYFAVLVLALAVSGCAKTDKAPAEVRERAPEGADSAATSSEAILKDAPLEEALLSERERKLIGGWVDRLNDPSDQECKNAKADEVCFPNDSMEMDFSLEDGRRVFRSYLHSRPLNSDCGWSLEGNVIKIDCGSSYEIVDLSQNSLTTKSEDGVQVWRRVGFSDASF